MFGCFGFWNLDFEILDFGAMLGLNSRGKPGGITRGVPQSVHIFTGQNWAAHVDNNEARSTSAAIVLRIQPLYRSSTYCMQKPPHLNVGDQNNTTFQSLGRHTKSTSNQILKDVGGSNKSRQR